MTKPNITKKIKQKNLIQHNVYCSKNKYKLVYINKQLYAQIFGEQYNANSKNILEKMFSITLDKNNSKFQLKNFGYADLQYDATGISTGENLGSGRAFFYLEKFNIKGEKTCLAKASDKYYSDGKFCLPACLKETTFANILSKDFCLPTFETLAVFDKKSSYVFRQQYQTENYEIKDEFFELPTAIEVRVYNNNQLFRLSNVMANGDKISTSKLLALAKNMGEIEADKFISRFLHGSWSAGNISVGANLIDFDTATFVAGRFPQFSNTNKYMASYFGFEKQGQQKLLEILFDYAKICEDDKRQVLNQLEQSYNSAKQKYFCDILGLDYKCDYLTKKQQIENLFVEFDELSRMFYPNYYSLNVNEENCQNTHIFDFSKFFQKYLAKRKKQKDILCAMNLLVNKTQIEEQSFAPTKEIAEKCFSKYIVEDTQKTMLWALEKIQKVVDLYEQIYDSFDAKKLNNIIYKSYVANSPRDYLYANQFVFSKISDMYQGGKITAKDIDVIVETLINSNLKKHKNNLCFAQLNLKIFDKGLWYIKLYKNKYNFVFVPFEKTKIEFAKLFVDKNEYMMKFKQHCLISEDICFDKIPDFDEIDIRLKINGKFPKLNAI